MHTLRAAALLAALLAVTACDGSPTGSHVTTDRIAFSFTGDASGAFTASGPVPADSAAWTAPFALAYQDPEGYVFSGYVPTSGGRGNRVVLFTTGPASAGTYDTDCDAGNAASRCLVALVVLNMDHSTPGADAGEKQYLGSHMTLAVTSVTATRIEATFSGALANGAQTLDVTGGTVSLPLTPR